MNPHIAITILLGAAAILSVRALSSLQNPLLRTGSSRWRLVDNITIKTENFENPVDFVRDSDIKPTVQRHAFAVQRSTENLPQVTIDGTLYEINSFVAIVLGQTGAKAVLEVTFTYRNNAKSRKDVVFLVPLRAVGDDDANLNVVLNNALQNLGTTPVKGIYKDTFQWLEPLLANITTVSSSPKQNLTTYLTDCQRVVVNEKLMPAF